jgi:hypothetical protein
MFNLGHTITLTPLQLQMVVQRVTNSQKHTVTHCLLRCCPTLKKDGPLMSGIFLLARIPSCVLYRDLMFDLVLIFELTFTTEPE